MKTIVIDPYLSEKNLEDVLSNIFEVQIERQVSVKIADRNLRVDYALKMPHNNQMLVVEFNGPTHYTSTKTIIRDYLLRDYCKLNNFRLVEIPYFIQLNEYTVEEYFGKDVFEYYIENNISFSNTIDSGFHEKKIVLPYDYCLLGLQRFREDMETSCKVKAGYELDEEYGLTSKKIYYSICDRSDDEIIMFDEFLYATEDTNEQINEFLKHEPT